VVLKRSILVFVMNKYQIFKIKDSNITSLFLFVFLKHFLQVMCIALMALFLQSKIR
jgi:hypothetical protein